MICPKCKHERNANDDPEIPDYQCPACGIIYAKYTARDEKLKREAAVVPDPNIVEVVDDQVDTEHGQEQTLGKKNIFAFALKAFGWVLLLTVGLAVGLVAVGPDFIPMIFVVPFVYFAIKNKSAGKPWIAFALIALVGFSWGMKGMQQSESILAVKQPVLSAEQVANNRAAKDKRIASAKKIAEDKKEADALAKAEKDTACNKELTCIVDKIIMIAGVHCPDHIEKLVKYRYEWTDGFLGTKFSRVFWANGEHTVVRAIGDKLRFENGFGAMQNMRYFCEININSENVVNFGIL